MPRYESIWSLCSTQMFLALISVSSSIKLVLQRPECVSLWAFNSSEEYSLSGSHIKRVIVVENQSFHQKFHLRAKQLLWVTMSEQFMHCCKSFGFDELIVNVSTPELPIVEIVHNIRFTFSAHTWTKMSLYIWGRTGVSLNCPFRKN